MRWLGKSCILYMLFRILCFGQHTSQLYIVCLILSRHSSILVSVRLNNLCSVHKYNENKQFPLKSLNVNWKSFYPFEVPDPFVRHKPLNLYAVIGCTHFHVQGEREAQQNFSVFVFSEIQN